MPQVAGGDVTRLECCGHISRRALLGGGAAAGLLAVAGSTPSSAATADSKLPAKGDSRYSVSHYAIGDTVLTGASGTHARVYGATTMTCRANVATTSILIDFALRPNSVTVDGVAKPYTVQTTARPYQFAVTGLSLAPGQQFTVQVGYNDIPWSRRAGDDVKRGHGVIENGTVTSFSGQPEVAVFWYPSNDRLDNKATYSISISTQKANQIIAYGAPAARPFGDGSMVNTRIVIPEPVSSYNPGLTVGPGLAMTRGTLSAAGVTVPYLYAGMASVPANLVTHTAKSLDYFARLYGPYPFSQSGGLTLTNFPVGGQEQVGLVQYRRSLVDGSPSFIAHENAHMWFGNSVTAKDWRDVLFIHEGLAVMLQNDYARHAGITGAYTATDPVVNVGNFGPTDLAKNAPYNAVYRAQHALRYAMDRSYLRENAPRNTAFLKELATTYRHANITRSQFKALAQKHSPVSLASVWADYGLTG